MIEVNAALTQKVADLARLELTPEEVQTYTAQLGNILKYVEKLNEVSVSGPAGPIAPLTHPFDLNTPLREDVVLASPVDSEGKPKVLKSAPDVLYEGYKVPSIL